MTGRLAQLAGFVADVPGTAIPDAAVMRAKQALVDLVGVTVAGVGEPVSRQILSFVARYGAAGDAALIGAAGSAGPLDAALANATVGHALDFDDSNFVLGGHPSVTLLPAVLALGEHIGASGRAVLEAYVIGFDVLARVARIVNFHHYEKGWHPTATMGVFGAAAACARLLRLDAGKTASALGLAASMASGIKANFGSMAKPVQVGHASRNGLFAALLAADGATASADALEGRQGFLAVYNGKGNFSEALLEGLGETWELLASGIMFKKYACCGSTHPVIDAATDLGREAPVDVDAIETVRVAINPRRLTHVNRPAVADPLQAKFSLQYTAAAALADGYVGLSHFTEAAIGRPDVQALLARVEAAALESVDSDLSQACEFTVTFRNGERRGIRLEAAHGRRAEDYESFKRMKFLDCAGLTLDAATAETLLARLEAFDELPRITETLRMTVPGARPAKLRIGG